MFPQNDEPQPTPPIETVVREKISEMPTLISKEPIYTSNDTLVDSGKMSPDTTPLPHISFKPGYFFAKYQILEKIAQGGMGAVFKVFHPVLQQKLALKILLAGQGVSADQVARFHNEAQSCSRLRHPHIVSIHDVGEFQGIHYLTMDFIEGKDLAHYLYEKEISYSESVTLIRKICEALVHAHAQRILHRDLKPANILIDNAGEPYITDFGLAKDISTKENLTQEGVVVGTPAYMPPEQARGEISKIGEYSDVYSLGAIFYELLTGRLPFISHSQVDLFQQILHQDPVAPRKFKRDVPRDIETICLKCLEKEPFRRYQTMKALLTDLDHYQNGRTINARKATLWEGIGKIIRRHKLISGIVLFFFLFLITSLAWGFQIAKEKIHRAKIQVALLEAECLNRDGASEQEVFAKFQQRLLLSSDYPELHIGIGQFFFHRGNYSRALSFFQQAFSLEQNSPQIHYFLSRVYEKLEDDQQTQHHLQFMKKNLLLQDASDFPLCRAYLLFHEKQEIQALERIRQILEQNPYDSESRLLYSEWLFRQKQYPEAYAEATLLLKRNPYLYAPRLIEGRYHLQTALLPLSKIHHELKEILKTIPLFPK